MNLSPLKNLFKKARRTKLNPDRAWLALLIALFLFFCFFTVSSVISYKNVEAEEIPEPGGERILSSREFVNVFKAYSEKEKEFGRLLDTAPNISDPAR